MQLEAGLPAGSSKDGVTEPPSDELLDEIVASAARLCDAPGAFLQWEGGEQGRREIRHGFEAVGAVDAPFRAPVALTGTEGQPLGELGVLDLRPREDGDRAARIIRELAPVAARAIEAQWKAQRLMEEIETEHRHAESLLAQSQARLRAIIDTEPECVKVVSDEGILLDMNAAGLRMIGAGSHLEAIGMPVIRLIHPEDRQAFLNLHERSLEGDTGQLEFRLKALDGAERWLSSHSTPLRGDDDYAAVHGEVQPGQYVAISVTDTGSGMAPEIVGKAFEPFFTTKESGKGSGLGLSMVYGFVKQSNGHVKIYSEPGLGTSARLYLPRERAENELGAEEPRPVAPTGGREKILVVEDDDLVRNFVVEQLEFLGYEVVWAASGPEALERLKQHADIDLLFTDAVMPGGMSGRVLANEAKEMRPDLPVLYTSGYTENAIVHHDRLDPGVQLLQKPYRRQDLARKIRQAIDGADRRRAS